MGSVEYIRSFTAVLIILISLGIGARCVQVALLGVLDGEEFPVVVKKIRKKIIALVLTVCTGTLIYIIQSYYI